MRHAPVQPAGRARAVDACGDPGPVPRPDARRLPLPHDRRRARAVAGRRDRVSREHGDHRHRQALHPAHADRHGEPRDLPDHAAARPDRAAAGAGLEVALGELEQAPDLYVRRRLHRRLVPPGRLDRRRDRRLHAVERLRARLLLAQRLRQQLQRPHRLRVDDDGEGALHRELRPARAHPGLGLLGRLVRPAPDRRQLPGPARRHHPGLLVPRGRLRHHPLHHRRVAARHVFQYQGGSAMER